MLRGFDGKFSQKLKTFSFFKTILISINFYLALIFYIRQKFLK